jgi:tocopherol O-methyltransferase
MHMPLKDRIAQHYDELTALYNDIWGIHLHHGYWKSGVVTKEAAQEQLIRELIERSEIGRCRRVLDVGCGVGGSAIYLSKALGAHVTGVTISQTQVAIGTDLARRSGANVRLIHMDAESLEIDEPFDVVWSVEAISHLSNRRRCFQSIARLLEPGGKLIVADWLRSPAPTSAQSCDVLELIERSMLVPTLEEPAAYCAYMKDAGLTVTLFEDFSMKVSKTWDVATDLIRNPALWRFAATRGRDFVAFLEGFAAMRRGYKSKALLYGALIAQKP